MDVITSISHVKYIFPLSLSFCLSSSRCSAGTERWGSGKMFLTLLFFFRFIYFFLILHQTFHATESCFEKTQTMQFLVVVSEWFGKETSPCRNGCFSLWVSLRGEKQALLFNFLTMWEARSQLWKAFSDLSFESNNNKKNWALFMYAFFWTFSLSEGFRDS